MNNSSAREVPPRIPPILVGCLAWLVVLTVAAGALALTSFASHDADSTLYAEISSRLSLQPFRAWLAPTWDGLWEKQGLFREHPVGIFVLPALLGRTGYPAGQAAFAIGAFCSMASLWLIRRLAALVVTAHEAIAAQWVALVLPIAFVYRIRANQEYPVLALTLVGLYAVHRARRSAIWIVGLAAAACGLALVKGVFVVFLPIVCALWLLMIPPDDRRAARTRDLTAWMGLALAMMAVAGLAAAYEWGYRRSTGGESFLSYYLYDRIVANAGLAPDDSVNPATKLYNLVWYLIRLLWFAVPGSLVLVASAGRVRRLSKEDVRKLGFALAASVAYVVAMSLGSNKADRFIFPAYFLTGVAGAIVAMRRWRAVDRLAQRLAALPAYALPAAWLSLFMLALL